jgi:methionyl-tRNA formyltransferase
VTRPRAIFFGTPAFAVPTLEALLEIAEVPLVITQPDRPAGRGMKLTPPPVKVVAQARGIEVLQPTKVRDGELAARMVAEAADVGVVVAYGRILPTAVLEAPRLGCVNVHASLLPRWRGAAPIQWAIAEGDAETGVCLMQMDDGMDTGAVLTSARTPIGADETAAELSERLSAMGADLLRRELPRFIAGGLVPSAQDHERATMAPLLTKEDGRLHFAWTAQRVHDRTRAMNPWPGAHTALDGRRVKIHRTKVLTREGRNEAPGTVTIADRNGICVACGEGQITLLELQLEGKRRVDAAAFIAGHGGLVGERFDGAST